MIQDLRIVIEEDGTKTIEASDGYCWYKIDEVQWFERKSK